MSNLVKTLQGLCLSLSHSKREPLDRAKSHDMENWFVCTYIAKKESKFFMEDRKFDLTRLPEHPEFLLPGAKQCSSMLFALK